jgi:hypothetical protein
MISFYLTFSKHLGRFLIGKPASRLHRAVNLRAIALGILLSGLPFSAVWSQNDSKNTKEMPAFQPGGYIWNGINRGSFDEISIPDGSSTRNLDVQGVNYWRNYFYINYFPMPRLMLYNGFSYQLQHNQFTPDDSFFQNFGDSLTGIRWYFRKGNRHSLAVDAGVKWPISDYPREILSSQGDGQVDLVPGLLYSFHFSAFSMKQSISGFLSFAHRLEEPADQLRARLFYKISLPWNLFLRMRLSWTHSLGGEELYSQRFYQIAARSGAEAAFASLKTRYLTAGLDLEYGILPNVYLGLHFARALYYLNSANITTAGVSIGMAY